jgi:hypothetical protein
MEVHTAEPLVFGPSRLEVVIAIAKLKKYKSPGSDQIPAELVHTGGEILLSAIHKLINSVWNKEELPDQWKESIIVPVHKKGIKLTVIIIVGYHCYQLHNKIVSNILLSRLGPYIDEIFDYHQCGFRYNRSTTIRFFAFIRYWM